jgi:hypothetical protein
MAECRGCGEEFDTSDGPGIYALHDEGACLLSKLSAAQSKLNRILELADQICPEENSCTEMQALVNCARGISVLSE